MSPLPGWQVTLCDPMWHVSSRSSVATLRTAIHLLLTYLLAETLMQWRVTSGGCMVESIMLSFLATLSVHGSSVDEPAVCVRCYRETDAMMCYARPWQTPSTTTVVGITRTT